mmetsp:Transcript_5735/g.7246  ORF Transcript_5735/g.7246 Transcript_5735/m.7246 type:complete len:630 (+) Transcript_5735:23-1912(+)
MKQLHLSASSLQESAKGVSESGKNRVYQMGFYILSTVGLEKILSTLAAKGEDLNMNLSNHITFSLSQTRNQHENADNKNKSRKEQKTKNNQSHNKKSGKRSRQRSKRSNRTLTPKEYEALVNSSLSVAVHEKRGKKKGMNGDDEHSHLHESVLEFLHKALRFLAEARTCTPQQLISRIMFSLAEALAGEPLDHHSQDSLEKAVGEIFREAKRQQVQNHHGMKNIHIRMSEDLTDLEALRAVTGLVVSYTEDVEQAPQKYEMRSMHQQIPSTPFCATVKLPRKLHVNYEDSLFGGRKRQNMLKDAEISIENDVWQGPLVENEEEISWLENNDIDCRKHTVAAKLCKSTSEIPTPCSAVSFPVSPPYREKVMTQNNKRTQVCLYRVREVLKSEQEHSARVKRSRFNVKDTHNNIVLTHHHLQAKLVPNINVSSCWSTRCGMPVRRDNVTSYFEVELKPVHNIRNSTDEPNVWIGLSTKSLPLDGITGSMRYSIGLSSSGYILRDSKWCGAVTNTESRVKVNYGDKVGVCCHWGDYVDIDYANQVKYRTLYVAFFVNGKRVYIEIDDNASYDEDDDYYLSNDECLSADEDEEDECHSCMHEEEEEKEDEVDSSNHNAERMHADSYPGRSIFF